MTTLEVANRYCALMQQNKRSQIIEELYSIDIVNKEPEWAIATGVPTITRGLDAVLEKAKARMEMIEKVHSDSCSDAIISDKFFSVAIGRDLTLKGKPRMTINEIGVFEVKDGKIILEQFFY